VIKRPPPAIQFLLLLLLVALAAPAGAVVRYREILVRAHDEIEPYMDHTSRWYTEENTSQPGRRYKTSLHDVYLSVPLFPTVKERNLSLQMRTGMRDLGTEIILPSTGTLFPDPFFDLGLGATYRWKMERGREAGFSFALASPSDDPFDKDASYRADIFYHKPIRPGRAWILYAHYRSDREYLPGIPLPGFGYLHRPNRFTTILLGLPYLLLDKQLSPSWRFLAEYEAPREATFELSHRLMKDLTIHVDAALTSENFFRRANPRTEERMTFRETRVGGGFRYALGPDVTFKAGGGYAFERYWYEGEDFSDRRRNRVEIDDAAYVEFGFGARF
jgi:hypothetical protein